MFTFALKMCVADLKKILQRFWWITILFVLLIVITPFHMSENMFAYTYIVGMSTVLLIPRYSRIHFIVPLDEEEMKKFFLWRVAIVCGTMLFMAAVFLVICLCLELPWDSKGLYWLLCYLSIFMLVAEAGLKGLGMKKDFKDGVREMIVIIVGIVCWIVGLFMMEYFQVKWVLGIAVAMLLVSTVYMLWYTRKIKIEDYTDVALSAWERGLQERD